MNRFRETTLTVVFRGFCVGSVFGDTSFRFFLVGSSIFAVPREASEASFSFLAFAFAFNAFCKSRFALIAAILAFWIHYTDKNGQNAKEKKTGIHVFPPF
jgi:hypothetical protein